MSTIYNPSNTEIKLAPEAVKAILASQDEGCADCIGYYGTLNELAQKICSSKHWAMGSVFVYAESDSKYVVLKQIAPDSSEMLTITARGYEDVLTSSLMTPTELEQSLSDYIEQRNPQWGQQAQSVNQ